MPCPRCGAESLPNERFCKNCGAPLAPAESAQSAPAAPAQPAVPQAPATLHPIPDGGLTLEEVVAWLQSAGYTAQVVMGKSSGKPHIETSSHGTPVTVAVDLKGGRTANLSFMAGFATDGKFDVSQINAWNYNNRWCTAYYDEVNDPWLGMAMDLWPGGTYEALNERFADWNRTVGGFIDTYLGTA